jgi:hypothetical protein
MWGSLVFLTILRLKLFPNIGLAFVIRFPLPLKALTLETAQEERWLLERVLGHRERFHECQ